MTWTKKQNLPALHQSGKVKNPDMPEVEQQNYTSTVLKYANLALPFPQLETDAKRVVPAINELYENRTIANPEAPADQDPLNTVQIAGTVYKIEGGGGGGDYTAGAGIYFTGDNNSVINADAGRFSPPYTYVNFSSEYDSLGLHYQWESSDESIDGHTVYKSYGNTYGEFEGDSLCTFEIMGYRSFTIFAKHDSGANPNDEYIALGNPDEDIDISANRYAISYKGQELPEFTAYTYTNLSTVSHTIQVLYHKQPSTIPSEGSGYVDLNNGQWRDSGMLEDGHAVYESDLGSWGISNGASLCTLHFEGVTSITIHYSISSEDGYDFLYLGALDSNVSTSDYEYRWSGEHFPEYKEAVYECSGDAHTIQLLYRKDGSSNIGNDRGYFYFVLGGPSGTEYQGSVYVVPADPVPSYGEIFNNYNNNRAIGTYSHAEGNSTIASGGNAHTEGYGTQAAAWASHAEGDDAVAKGDSSHAEGLRTIASGAQAHAEGHETQALGDFSHSEGYLTVASGERAHAEGASTVASGENSHAEGRQTQATGWRAHAEGGYTLASAIGSHAEGFESQATADDAHAEGYQTHATSTYAHSEGYNTEASGSDSHAEGNETVASADHAHAEGYYSVASGEGSHAEGYGDSNTQVISSGKGSHAEGGFTQATADFAHAEGRFTIASGLGAHAEGFGGYGGQYNTATGIGAHAEGSGNLVSGNCGHAEGTRNTVYSESGHADGSGNQVYGRESHATGSGNIVSEQSGYIEGAGNRNIAFSAHVEGAGNRNTYEAHISHTEGAGNTNYGHQAHLEGSGNRLSGEESHLEGAGNILHGHKSHMEGGGNIAYTFGSHIEGKHNTAVGYGHHAEGINNYVGFNGTPGYFSYGTTYEVGNIVGVNTAYIDSYSAYPETDTRYLYRCITAPGQIQQSSTVNIVTPDIWDSSVTYQSGAVVQLSNVGFYYNSSSESVTGTLPTDGWPWTRIYSILSPFKTSGSGYYMLDCDEVQGANKIAVVYDTVQPMWEPLSNTSGGHVEGIGNIAIGDYQHVQGKFNVDDATKAFIIGNGTDEDHRSNALTVDWSGNATIAGDLTTGTTLNTTAQTIGAAINEISVRVPTPPTTDGHYTLSLTITNGVPTYSWVSS